MHDARGTEPRARGGGIPDGALVGLLAFLLGLAVLVWSATGLAALFARGAWPATVTFTRTPGAVRALIAQPHDIPGAWPDTDPAALSGWGLFWGLFISQLLALLVLTIFTLGVVARTKARRRTRSRQPSKDPGADASEGPGTRTQDPHRRPATDPGMEPHPGPGRQDTPPASGHPGPRTPPEAARHRAPRTDAHPTTAPALGPDTGTARTGPAAHPDTNQDAPRNGNGPEHGSGHGIGAGTGDGPGDGHRTGDAARDGHTTRHGTGDRYAAPATAVTTTPADTPTQTPHALPEHGLPLHAPATTPAPTPPATFPGPSQPTAAPLSSSAAHAPVSAPAPPRGPAHPSASPRTPATAQEAYRYGFGYAPPTRTAPAPPAHRLAYAAPAERHHLAARAIAAAEGSVLVVTSSPALWQDTKDARAKLGPVLLYDPSHLCDTPARMHWNPADGCADRDAAAARAVALLAPVRPQARLDAAVADTAETLLRSWLQAAALDGLPFKQLARWAQGNGSQEPVRILRTHPQAAPGAAGELESALIAHPERREQAQYLTARALSCLTSIHIREACNPNRTDALTLASFAAEGGTLYVVGESLEDPRTRPGAMPLLTALASHVVEHGRRMAVRSSHGRLDPPMTLVLEDVAAVAPVPQLPGLLTDEALPLLALCRSREQARTRWPDWPVA
ncbi:hypothetical protein [Streptomyces sp. NPDC001389]|uniref:hypothetical protein n=1 Tax=Streptomyces sp. NPDC001389 TaxID=3364569 RepID=UPI003693A8CA